MILTSIVKDLWRGRSTDARARAADDGRATVLNVGGGSRQIPIPDHYAGWREVRLDIDRQCQPDVVCDARELGTFEAARYDAVHCSHNLEHYYRHDGAKVLRGFLHVLKPDGFAEIRVPDLASVMRHAVATGMDVDDTLYVSPAGPITVADVIYGLGRQIESSGVDFFAHKTGYTAASLRTALARAGFAQVFVAERPEIYELRAVAFKGAATPRQRALLGV